MSVMFLRSVFVLIAVSGFFFSFKTPANAQGSFLNPIGEGRSPEDRLYQAEQRFEWLCKLIDEYREEFVEADNRLSLIKVNTSTTSNLAVKAGKWTPELSKRYNRWVGRWQRAQSDVYVAKSLLEERTLEKQKVKDEIAELKPWVSRADPRPAPGGGGQAGGAKGTKQLRDAEKGLKDLRRGVDEIADKVAKTGRDVADVVEEAEELTRALRDSIARNTPLTPVNVPAAGPDNGSGQPDVAAAFRKFSIDGGIGYQRERLPDYQFGVTSLGTNLTPLHDFAPRLDGIRADLGIGLELPGPIANTSWVGRIGGGVSRTKGTGRQTIGGFAPGQAPAYIDLAGTGGFAFNNNSLVKLDVDATRFDINGEFGIKKVFSNGIIANPYAGAFFRHSQVDYDLTMNTDFLNGRFVNTLNERLRLNQFGADVGLDLTWQPHERVSLSIGGHAGLAYTDASYSGRDCGDGSLLTPGCDGALFANGGVSRGRESVDPFAGVKAAIGIYLFCRQNAVPIAAHALNAAARALKSSCVSVGAQGTFDVMPSVSIDHSTALGGPSVGLSGDNSKFYSASGRVTLPF